MPFQGVNPPTEPRNYDPENRYRDPVAYFQHREAAVAEKFVHIAEAKVKPLLLDMQRFLISKQTRGD